MSIEKAVLKKKPRVSLMEVGFEGGYESGKKDGLFEGYEEGYSKGRNEGHEEGYKRGLGMFDMGVAEQMDVLITAMAMLLGNTEKLNDQFVLLRTISEVNAKNMVIPENAWHKTNKTLTKKRGTA
jgi:flagellar biosynthesis/type III secretory pathway protein FliH